MLQYHSNMVALRLTYYTLQLKSRTIFGASPCPKVWTVGLRAEASPQWIDASGCNERNEAYHQPVDAQL